MLYFKPNLIKIAQKIIYAKEAYDDGKSLAYLEAINQIMEDYKSTGVFILQDVIKLDCAIRNDYPEVDELKRFPSCRKPQQQVANSVEYPDAINSLVIDAFGIMVSVLKKKGIISAVKDALDI